MIYYKVKSKNDNIELYAKNEFYNYFKKINFVISGELITKKELEKILKDYNFYNFQCNELAKKQYYYTKKELIKNIFDIVEINKNKTYIAFGARFAE